MSRQYTLITGASYGIGEALAIELAQRGQNLILISRSGDKLHQLKSQLEYSYRIDIVLLACDLASEEGQSQAEGLFEKYRISTAILNAAQEWTGAFLDCSLEKMTSIISLNVMSNVRILHTLLEKMRLNGKGSVVVVSSVAALSPMPYCSIYASTKAFMLHLANALQFELEKANVNIATVCVGRTDTGMTRNMNVDNDKMAMKFVTAKESALSIIDKIGKRGSFIVGRDNQLLFGFIRRITPDRFLISLIGRMFENALIRTSLRSEPSALFGQRAKVESD